MARALKMAMVLFGAVLASEGILDVVVPQERPKLMEGASVTDNFGFAHRGWSRLSVTQVPRPSAFRRSTNRRTAGIIATRAQASPPNAPQPPSASRPNRFE